MSNKQEKRRLEKRPDVGTHTSWWRSAPQTFAWRHSMARLPRSKWLFSIVFVVPLMLATACGDTDVAGARGREGGGDQSQLAQQAGITPEQAQAAALAALPGSVQRTRLERDNGNVVYAVTVAPRGGGASRDVEVDANTGSVLKRRQSDRTRTRATTTTDRVLVRRARSALEAVASHSGELVQQTTTSQRRATSVRANGFRDGARTLLPGRNGRSLRAPEGGSHAGKRRFSRRPADRTGRCGIS